jgi:hypothetical protein
MTSLSSSVPSLAVDYGAGGLQEWMGVADESQG